MQIFSREQIRAWDEYTIVNEPVSGKGLMERAAGACYTWLMENGFDKSSFIIFCGKGNNGGDGVALGRMLEEAGRTVKVVKQESVSDPDILPVITKDEVIIDALLGTGLNRAVEGRTASIIQHINNSGNIIISIDIPSGLYADRSSKGNMVVTANYTLSFQCYKLAFMMAENEKYIGEVHILDIGLHPGYLQTINSRFKIIDKEFIKPLLKKRGKFSHKGNFGHAALLAGSKGMMGAALMCARAVIRSGAGKLTCHLAASGINILQSGVPEAMCKEEEGDDFITSVSELKEYSAIGIGPGLGKHETHVAILEKVFESNIPLIADADALNTIAANSSLLKKIKPETIITPHPGEFARLFGKVENNFDNIQLALDKSKELNIYIVLKGAYTFIASPDGTGYFNTSGNPGMAKGGSGDVLTGVITGLLAQKYEPLHAALIGVYVHGCAGDFAALKYSQTSMIATDIIEHLGDAFNSIDA